MGLTGPPYYLMSGTVHGVKHAQLGVNNQDDLAVATFSIPKWERNYRIGIVSDGATGLPAFTRTEVGSRLTTAFCVARLQAFIKGGTATENLPIALYPALTEFLRNLASDVMPATTFWPYPGKFQGPNDYRNQLNATNRFITDYLAATVLGFVDDGETLVTFQAGDGTIIVNDEVMVTDQNDRPDYPVLSIDSPRGGFEVNTYPLDTIRRLALCSDGVEELLELPGLDLPQLLFCGSADKPMALQVLLKRLLREYGHKMGDDCTVITLQRQATEEVSDGQNGPPG
jgi:hypothetical protein